MRLAYTPHRPAIFAAALLGALVVWCSFGLARGWAARSLLRAEARGLTLDGAPLVERAERGAPAPRRDAARGSAAGAVLQLVVALGVVFALWAYGYRPWTRGAPDTQWPLLIAATALAPAIAFARYRAAAFAVSGLANRGARLGLEPDAWRYAWPSLLFTPGLVATAGLAAPFASFWRARFMIERIEAPGARFRVSGGARRLLLGDLPVGFATLGVVALWTVVGDLGAADLNWILVDNRIWPSAAALSLALVWRRATHLVFYRARVAAITPDGETWRALAPLGAGRVFLAGLGGLPAFAFTAVFAVILSVPAFFTLIAGALAADRTWGGRNADLLDGAGMLLISWALWSLAAAILSAGWRCFVESRLRAAALRDATVARDGGRRAL